MVTNLFNGTFKKKYSYLQCLCMLFPMVPTAQLKTELSNYKRGTELTNVSFYRLIHPMHPM